MSSKSTKNMFLNSTFLKVTFHKFQYVLTSPNPLRQASVDKIASGALHIISEMYEIPLCNLNKPTNHQSTSL